MGNSAGNKGGEHKAQDSRSDTPAYDPNSDPEFLEFMKDFELECKKPKPSAAEQRQRQQELANKRLADEKERQRLAGEWVEYFKVLIIGSRFVGKTGLLQRFCDNTFTEDFSYPYDFKGRTIEVGNRMIELKVWHTPLQRCSSLYRGAHGVIVVYDITNLHSFSDVTSTWLKEIERYAPDENIPKLLVGNKCDLESKRVVSVDQGKDLSNMQMIPFVETSAKDSVNVEEAFIKLVANILKDGHKPHSYHKTINKT